MNIFVILPLVALVVNIFLLIYVLRKNPKGKLNLIYAVMTAAVALWCFSASVKFMQADTGAALFWEGSDGFFSLVSTSVFAHFILVYTKSRFASRKFVIPMYAGFFGVALLSYTSLMVEGLRPVPWGHMVVPGPFYGPLFSLIAVTIIGSILLCVRKYFKSVSMEEKKQARLISIGFGMVFVLASLTEIVPSVMGIEFPPFSSSSTTILAAIIAYAIFRYNLMSLTPAIAAERIIETMADYLVVADKEKKIAFTSKSAGNALGYRKDEMAGKDVSMVFAGKGTPDEIIGKLSKSEYVGNVDAEVSGKNGEKIPVSVNASTIRNGPETLGYIFLMRDMRETRKLIKGLEEKTRLLEERTKELEASKKKLETQMEESERLNKLAVGRELKMVELKKRISTLEGGKG